jgi:hypothetical protein
MKNSWPQIRAALIAFHIIAMMLVAFPSPAPAGLNTNVDDPNLVVHLRPWARLFGTDTQSFARRIFAIGRTWLDVRTRVVAPFEFYLDTTGAIQSWHMFSAPNHMPARFLLEARRSDGDWQFVSGLPAGEWHRSFFTSERVRSLLNVIGKYENDQVTDPFCLRVARELLAERDFAEARCQFVRVAVPSMSDPEGPRESRVTYSRVVPR